MNWTAGNGNKPWTAGNYQVERLISPEFHFSAMWRTSLYDRQCLAVCETAEEAKTVCETHARGEK